MGKSPPPRQPRPEDLYNSGSDSFEISSDEEPKTMMSSLKKSFKSKFCPTERARIAEEKKELRRGMIEFGHETLVDGYPKSLTREEWELVERIKRNPELKRRFRPDERPAERAKRESYKPEISRTIESQGSGRDPGFVVGSEQRGYVTVGGQSQSSGQPATGSSHHTQVPLASQRASSLHSFQALVSRVPSSHPHPPPAYTPTAQPNRISQISHTNSYQSPAQPNITIARSTPPSGTRVHQQTALADLGNMNRTYIEGFDAPAGNLQPMQMKRALGNMQKTRLVGLVEEKDEDEKE